MKLFALLFIQTAYGLSSTSSQRLSCECGGMGCPMCGGGFSPIVQTKPISKLADTNPLKLPARASPVILNSAPLPSNTIRTLHSAPLPFIRTAPSRVLVDAF